VLMMDTHYLFPGPFEIQNNVAQENPHCRAKNLQGWSWQVLHCYEGN
jgi:hypothetical protein